MMRGPVAAQDERVTSEGASVVYTGQVAQGGDADLKELRDVAIRKASVSAMDNNAYLLTCRATGVQALIDAADDAPRLLRLVEQGADSGGRGLDLVVTTHQHWDHHRALADLLAATGARSAAGRQDAEALPVAPDLLLDQGDTVAIGDLRLEVVQLRGHTPGSVALVLRSHDGSTHAFTGDSLFPGGVGNTRGDATNFRSLLDDVEQRLFGTLPDDTWVYPGHGRDTTLGTERPALPLWRERGC
jgi:glyoxylase-like metal-dependent hydrolase (beta-lactamase superfamily II)